MSPLLIVIVNYRTAGLVVDCLRSLSVELPRVPGMRVVVTDNASGDDSVQIIGKAIETLGFGDWATLLPLEHNGGFAYGNNEGIRYAEQQGGLPPYVLLLNPDTVVLENGVAALMSFMEQHPNVGIAGSRLENPDTTARHSAFRFASIASEFERGARLGLVTRLLRSKIVAPEIRNEQHQTDWVAGASMIVRKEVFDDIGLMDGEYFLYYEESDFCLLAHRAGWECWYVPESRVVHLVGQSTGVTGAKRNLKPLPTYWYESRRRYFRKNYGGVYAVLTDLAWLAGHLIYRAKAAVTRAPREDPPGMLGGFVRHSLCGRRKPA